MKPILSAIVAISENHVIGYQNQLPWHLPADLKHFKDITTGHPIIMGRKTYQSIGKPLPNRSNIIITRDPDFMAAACLIAASIEEAILLAATTNTNEAFIIGGAEIYKTSLPLVQRIYLTVIHHTFAGDAFFPILDENTWKEVSREDHAADEKNAFHYSFIVMERY